MRTKGVKASKSPRWLNQKKRLSTEAFLGSGLRNTGLIWHVPYNNFDYGGLPYFFPVVPMISIVIDFGSVMIASYGQCLQMDFLDVVTHFGRLCDVWGTAKHVIIIIHQSHNLTVQSSLMYKQSSLQS